MLKLSTPAGTPTSTPETQRPDANAQDGAEASDRDLMERVRGGSREALRELVERYWSPLVTYAAGVVSSADEAEDVVQEAFVRVWRFRTGWQPSGTVAAYLYRITRNLALNSIRDVRSQRRREERGGLDLVEAAVEPSASDHLEEASLRSAVEAAIAKLPERRREIFVLSRFHGMSHREIADAMGISLPTVSNQMTSALAQLREALAAHLESR